MKVTKKQRKANRNPNAMVLRSLKTGAEQIVGNRMYLGKNVGYQRDPFVVGVVVKASKGVPFVRVNY